MFYRFSQRIRHKKVSDISSPDSKPATSGYSPKKKSMFAYFLFSLFSHRKNLIYFLAGKSNASDASDSPSKTTSQSETSSSLAALFEPPGGGDSLDGTHLFEHWEDDETETDTYLASLRLMVEGVTITKSHGSTAALNESDAERDASSAAANESKSTASARLAAGATLFDDGDMDSQQQQDSPADLHLRRQSESESDLPDEFAPFSPHRTEDAAESKPNSAYRTRIRTGTIPRQNFTFAKAFLPSGTWTPQSTAESARRRPHRKETQHSASEDIAAAHAESQSDSSVVLSSSAPSQSASAKKQSAANSSDPPVDEFDDLPVEGVDVEVVDEAEATAEEEEEEEEVFASDSSVPSRAEPAAAEGASAEEPPAAEGEAERESSSAPPAAAAPHSAPEAPTSDASEPTTLASAQPDEVPVKLVPIAPKPAPISSAKLQHTVQYSLQCPLLRVELLYLLFNLECISKFPDVN